MCHCQPKNTGKSGGLTVETSPLSARDSELVSRSGSNVLAKPTVKLIKVLELAGHQWNIVGCKSNLSTHNHQLSGEVIHQGAEVTLAENEVLLCCARPASQGIDTMAEIRLDI